MTMQNDTHICAELYQLQAVCIPYMWSSKAGFMNLAFVWHADSREFRAFLNGIRVAALTDSVRYSAGYTPRFGRLHLGEMVISNYELNMPTFHLLKLRDLAILKRALEDSEIYKCLGISRMT